MVCLRDWDIIIPSIISLFSSLQECFNNKILPSNFKIKFPNFKVLKSLYGLEEAERQAQTVFTFNEIMKHFQ
jgi:hypothetical protein